MAALLSITKDIKAINVFIVKLINIDYLRELLIYIDPGFLDNIGHYRSFAENIHKEALKRNVDIWHLVSKDVSGDAARRFGLSNVFQYKAILKEDFYSNGYNSKTSKLGLAIKKLILDKLSVIEKFNTGETFNFKKVLRLFKDISHSYNTRALKSFSKILEMTMNRVLKSNYDKIIIYMYTSHPLYFPVFAKILNSAAYSQLNIKAYLGLFYLNNKFCMELPVPEYTEMLNSASNLLEIYDPDQKVHICADSERTISAYSSYLQRQIRLFPLPLENAVDTCNITHESKQDNGKITIGFFGYTHIKQGYHMAYQLYKQITNMNDYLHVYFVVRHNINFLNHEIRKVVKSFSKETKRIVHINGDLPKDKYLEQLSNCDIILIPHSRDEYPCQTSGLFVDALNKGKIIIAPDDTWMSDMIKEYGSGETFASNNSASFITAVKKTCDNISRYTADTKKTIESFSKFHTAKSLFDIIELG